ncbi:TRAP transporter substrate-binding protein [Paracraurococcus ruber]|uniref:ABC transporter substrate-binding protein n=1 Tax=Paracraurococcus ruber TaxID=77675 RepID=A0ABS1CUB0_9PROT|nr:TRAP transporter substrate-binding protein DctP [Paracraurococcus ruber]MBK1658079.1 ABC transporter substrate-binding protein [Paracraurococcus ruber]TDG34181.1 ABC transporter substrate-binding protein [Paracraurococcus ruber]
MHRRPLGRLVLGAAATAPVALATPALAQSSPEVRWRCASAFPRNLDVLYGTGERITQRVAALTDNRFQIRFFAAGEIVPGLQVLDAVQAGTIEAGHTPVYYYTGKDPSFAFFTALPFGLNARQNLAWLSHGGGNELAAELFREYSLVGFPAGDTGAQMGGWFRNEIRGLQDLNGLKFRVAGLAGEIFRRMGAVPTQIAASDIYPALERGTLDAVEFVGPHDDEKLGFVRVARNYYAPGFWEAGAHLHLLANQAEFDKLPAAYKAALEVACQEANADMLARYDHLNPQALRRLVAGGAQLRFWPRDILQAAWREAHGLYDDMSGRNERFRRIWTAYRAYRDEQYQWFRVAENSFDNFAFPAAAQRG